jgi:competence ComEA-like helix-hairpin-helix protein
MAQRDAIQILEKDHRQVRSLLTKLRRGRGSAEERGALVAELVKAVREHTAIEEEIFYPAFHEIVRGKRDERLFYEANEEHHVVDLVLPELEAAPPGSMKFMAIAKVVSDLLLHHLEEEEEEIFPKVQKALDAARLDELGDSLRRRKEELASEMPSAAARAQNGKAKAARPKPKGRARRPAKLDLNSAEIDDLVRIEGISQARARSLVDYRDSHGAFHEWSDLLAVRGISRNLLHRLQDGATIGH